MAIKLRLLDSRSGEIKNIVFYDFEEALSFLRDNFRRSTDVILLFKQVSAHETLSSSESSSMNVIRGLRKHSKAA